MLGLVAFVMLSPQAQEAVFGEFGGVDEFLQSQLAPYHIYPNEASYTLSKTYEHTKEFGEWTGHREHFDSTNVHVVFVRTGPVCRPGGG